MKKIFLDLDGVIVDWDQGVIDWFNLDATHEDVTHWGSLCDMTGLSDADFWGQLCEEWFWEGLKFTEYAAEVLYYLKDLDVCLLTSPAMHTAGWRQNWIQKNLPEYFHAKRYLIGPGKEHVARADTILIDDYEVNVNKFREAGGEAILFPQPWNSNKGKDKVDYLRKALYDLEAY